MKLPKGYKEEEEAWLKDLAEKKKLLQETDYTRSLFGGISVKPEPKTQEDLLREMMRRVLEGPPPSIRVIAQFGYSKYDFTVTNTNELQLLQLVIDKFRNSFDSTY